MRFSKSISAVLTVLILAVSAQSQTSRDLATDQRVRDWLRYRSFIFPGVADEYIRQVLTPPHSLQSLGVCLTGWR